MTRSEREALKRLWKEGTIGIPVDKKLLLLITSLKFTMSHLNTESMRAASLSCRLKLTA